MCCNEMAKTEKTMLKACTLIRRKPNMSVEEFQTYWRFTHAEVVRQLPHVKRYVQSHPLIGGYRKGDLIYDGLAEIWVDDTNSLREMAPTDAYRNVVADEENFIDRQSLTLILTEEHVIKNGSAPKNGVKNIEFVTRKLGMDIQSFQQYWRGTHGKIASEIPTVQRYVQSHTKLSGYKRDPQPAWDGIAITWFDSVDGMRAGVTTEAYANTRADEVNFIKEGKPAFIITKEHVIIS